MEVNCDCSEVLVGLSRETQRKSLTKTEALGDPPELSGGSKSSQELTVS